MFFRRRLNTEEFEILNKKIVLLVGDVDVLKTEIVNLKGRLNSMQGRMNRERKFDVEESEDLNNSVLLTNNGLPISDKQRVGLS